MLHKSPIYGRCINDAGRWLLSGVEGGDDEAAESGVVTGGRGGAVVLAVGGVAALPFGALGGIVEDDRGLLDSHAERGAGLALFSGSRATERVVERIGVGAAVAGAENDAVIAFEFALNGVKGDAWLDFCHDCNDLDRPYMVDTVMLVR